MEGSGDGSPQSSMCMVKAAELFPKPILEKEEEKLTVRFTERKCSPVGVTRKRCDTL